MKSQLPIICREFLVVLSVFSIFVVSPDAGKTFKTPDHAGLSQDMGCFKLSCTWVTHDFVDVTSSPGCRRETHVLAECMIGAS